MRKIRINDQLYSLDLHNFEQLQAVAPADSKFGAVNRSPKTENHHEALAILVALREASGTPAEPDEKAYVLTLVSKEFNRTAEILAYFPNEAKDVLDLEKEAVIEIEVSDSQSEKKITGPGDSCVARKPVSSGIVPLAPTDGFRPGRIRIASAKKQAAFILIRDVLSEDLPSDSEPVTSVNLQTRKFSYPDGSIRLTPDEIGIVEYYYKEKNETGEGEIFLSEAARETFGVNTKRTNPSKVFRTSKTKIFNKIFRRIDTNGLYSLQTGVSIISE